MADGDGALGDVEQFGDEVLDVARRNPGGAEAGADVAGQQIGGLHGFQRLDVAAGRRDRGLAAASAVLSFARTSPLK